MTEDKLGQKMLEFERSQTKIIEGARKTRANDQSRLGAATEEKLTQCLWHSSPRRDGWTG